MRITRRAALPQLPDRQPADVDQGPCGDWMSRMKVRRRHWGSAATRLTFAGPYAASAASKPNYSVLAHAHYVRGLFQIMARFGWDVHRTVRDGESAATRVLLAAVRSPPWPKSCATSTSSRNNVMARQLFMTIGAVRGWYPGHPEKGAQARDRSGWPGKGFVYSGTGARKRLRPVAYRTRQREKPGTVAALCRIRSR